MASSFTSSLRLEMIGIGEQTATWGGSNSSNLRMLEAAISGIAGVVMASDADRTLSVANNSPDEARNAFLLVTSGVALTASRSIVVPSGVGATKLYVVKNATTGGQSIVVKPASGAGVVVPNGQTRFIYCDGTDCALAVDVAGEIGGGAVQAGSLIWSAKVGAANAGYLWCDGAAYSRSTYRTLFEAITLRPTGNTASGSPTITSVSSTTDVLAGMPISGTGIPGGTTVLSVGAGTITLSANATASGTGVALCIAPYGVGDGSTTFNVPDGVGSALFYADVGEGTGRLTAAVSGIVQRIGARGGDQRIGNHTHAITDPGHAHGYSDPGHSHYVNDPGHAHSAWTDSQGTHQHHIGEVYGLGATWADGAIGNQLYVGGTTYIGKITDAAGNHGHNVGIGGAGTGIYLSGSGVGITIGGSGTGITIDASGGGTGANIPPALMGRLQIKY